jgi:hypothetical protein
MREYNIYLWQDISYYVENINKAHLKYRKLTENIQKLYRKNRENKKTQVIKEDIMFVFEKHIMFFLFGSRSPRTILFFREIVIKKQQ